jgi:hypothetical protein
MANSQWKIAKGRVSTGTSRSFVLESLLVVRSRSFPLAPARFTLGEGRRVAPTLKTIQGSFLNHRV